MSTLMRDTIIQQHNIAWSLLEYHLNGIENEECLWEPRDKGLFVHSDENNNWIIDWPESEEYSIGPPNIAWITWHIIFWWSMALNHSFSDGSLKQEDIKWPGSIDAAKQTISQLHKEWVSYLENLTEEDFSSTAMTKWPLQAKPFCDLAAWLNLELMKNAAEIGYCRFLFATKE